jgi:hypothetical protein
VQAAARDLFAEQLLAIHRYLSNVDDASSFVVPAEQCSAGVSPALSSDICPPTSAPLGRIVFHVHDEVIVEVPASLAEQVRVEILSIMSIPPAWLPACPVEAEATINHHYTK